MSLQHSAPEDPIPAENLTPSLCFENMKLDELAAKRVNEFALFVQPLKTQGGSGSTVALIAIR